MSILLESLSQQQANRNKQVPDLTDSHFDDDILGDEWLIRKVKIWQVASISLTCLLLISWGVFYWYIDGLDNQQALNIAVDTNASDKVLPVNDGSVRPTSPNPDNSTGKQASTAVGSNTVARTDNDPSSKKVYKPQKRQQQSQVPLNTPVVDSANTFDSHSSEPAIVSAQTSESSERANTPASNSVEAGSEGAPLTLEALSAEMRQQFPNIEINSFVVSENPENSFVILDGNFYKINQVIAPNLILRDISKEAIVIEFKGQKVSLPNQ
ncbi:hypothetical protein FLL45_07910 [Aliikangiella marina]|uniref:Type II secretion system protein GspB C-terminal domain-containing protein n=1 Tax=Aliikangiella marina TaxID=1712262 RepID=A0A545TCG5_9GAMM|nr:general secretion pathway protein GspB [Aliikangiella marina]TQV74876.1 hypothetical protein FLL45_07910 [Aliikangiella marina]